MIAIGAMTTTAHGRAVRAGADAAAALPRGDAFIAHPQIRNRGTVGGSLAHADPSAEYPAVALALDAEFRIAGDGGERTVKAGDFFVTYAHHRAGAAGDADRGSPPAAGSGTGWSVQEVSRRHGDFAMAGVLRRRDVDGGRECSARIVLFGVGPAAVRAARPSRCSPGSRRGASCEQRRAERSEAIEEPLSDIARLRRSTGAHLARC